MPIPDPIAKPTFSTDEKVDASAVITLPAVEKSVNVVNSIDWSFSGSPTSAELTVAIDGVVKWRVDVTSAGPGSKEWGRAGIFGEINQSVIVTLTAGGPGTTGNINVESRLI